MSKKHGTMIVSVVAATAMTAALALTASAASNLPEIAASAEIPTAATVIDGPALEGINWLHATGASVVSFASDLGDAKLVSTDGTAVVDRNANTSMLVVKDGVNADLVFAGENNNPDAPIKIVFAEKMDNVSVRAADNIELIQE